MPCLVPGCGWLFDPCPFHGTAKPRTPPPIKETGRDLRDRALDQVEANAEAAWLATAEVVLCDLASTGEEFTSEDFWNRGLPRPREPRALGPVLMRAAKGGLIRATGTWRYSQKPDQHSRPLRVWQGIRVATLKGDA